VKVFFDTNVLLAAFLAEGASHRALAEAVGGKCEPVVSEQVLKEMEEKLLEKFRVPPRIVRESIELIRSSCDVVPVPDRAPEICRDPDDDAILAAAAAARVEFLITGDKDLLILGRFERMRIVTPAEFLREISR
jgi:putative PIN family toxin of toxin-antitoxin system